MRTATNPASRWLFPGCGAGQPLRAETLDLRPGAPAAAVAVPPSASLSFKHPRRWSPQPSATTTRPPADSSPKLAGPGADAAGDHNRLPRSFLENQRATSCSSMCVPDSPDTHGDRHRPDQPQRRRTRDSRIREPVTHRHPRDVLGRDGLLVVGEQVGRHPTHPAQGALSTAANTLGGLSQISTTTRNRLQASQKQNSVVATRVDPRSIRRSRTEHAGSVAHGRNTRRCPAAWAALRTATARRGSRCKTVKPIATSLSWATSARTLPGSARPAPPAWARTRRSCWAGRRGGRARWPRPAAASWPTVLGEQPASSPASRNDAGQVERFQACS